MKLTKPSLIIFAVISDKADEDLRFLHIEQDGSSVASDGRCILAVSPNQLGDNPLLKDIPSQDAPAVGLNLPPETVAQVLSLMPREIPLQIALLSDCTTERIEFSVLGRGRINKVQTLHSFRRFPEWRQVFKNLICQEGFNERPISRRRLLKVLKLMDDACADKSEDSPVFLHMGKTENAPLILRTRNYATGQDIVGMIQCSEYHSSSKPSNWISQLFNLILSPLRKRRKVRRKAKRNPPDAGSGG